MAFHLAGQVTFASNSARNRASRAVAKLIADWNSAHPAAEDFTTVQMLDTILIDGLAAIDFHYTCPTSEPIELAHAAIHFDIDSNAYVDMLGLSTWEG